MNPTTVRPTWSAGEHGLSGTRDGTTAALDPACPADGLTVGPFAGSACRLLAVELGAAPALIDHWVRGDDVVAVYEPADARRLRTTAMWRWLESGVAAPAGTAAWLVVVSAQTALLDSDPRITVDSRIPGNCVRWAASTADPPRWRVGADPVANAALVRGPDQRSVLIAVHPADRRSFTVGIAPDRVTVRCGLFSGRVEKGVLLRGRVLAAVGPTAGDDAWASRLLDHLDAEPPPLTA